MPFGVLKLAVVVEVVVEVVAEDLLNALRESVAEIEAGGTGRSMSGFFVWSGWRISAKEGDEGGKWSEMSGKAGRWACARRDKTTHCAQAGV